MSKYKVKEFRPAVLSHFLSVGVTGDIKKCHYTVCFYGFTDSYTGFSLFDKDIGFFFFSSFPFYFGISFGKYYKISACNNSV